MVYPAPSEVPGYLNFGEGRDFTRMRQLALQPSSFAVLVLLYLPSVDDAGHLFISPDQEQFGKPLHCRWPHHAESLAANTMFRIVFRSSGEASQRNQLDPIEIERIGLTLLNAI